MEKYHDHNIKFRKGKHIMSRTEKITLNEERNVTLTACLQDVGGEFGNIPKRPAPLLCAWE